MNILHVIGSLDPAAGGTTAALADLTRYQAIAGQRVAVCTTDRGHPPSKLLGVEAVARVLKTAVDLHCFAVDFSPLLYSRSMARWMMDNISRFDVVHIHGVYRFPMTYAARCAHMQAVPYIVRPHGALDPYLFRQSSASVVLKRLYEHWFALPLLNSAGAIHYTSEDERERASFLRLRAPSFVVPNGIDWDRFEQLPRRGAFRAGLGIGAALLVLFLGRVNFKKGLDLLVPAFAQLRRLHPDAHLAIVGPDNEGYGARVRQWVRECGLEQWVHLVDQLDGPEILQAYVDAEVFVLPSYTENFGMTVVEAMACGTPVVISDQVNIHRAVRDASAGLVTRCDVDEIAEATAALLSDEARRQAMGAAGRCAARDLYSWPPIVRQLTLEYEAVIARMRGSKGHGANPYARSPA
jgi:glycosyltransferase involved in cell wall biosynthesis